MSHLTCAATKNFLAQLGIEGPLLTTEDVFTLAKATIDIEDLRLLFDTDNLEALTALADNLASNTSVKELGIATTKPLPKEPFVKVFETNTAITELNCWKMDAVNPFQVGPILAVSKNLKVLYLEREPDAEFIKGLKKNTTLVELHWSSPQPACLFEFWYAMKEGAISIQKLTLRYAPLSNNLSCNGMKKALSRTTTLKELHFDCCKTGNNNVLNEAISGFKDNQSIWKLVIDNNDDPLIFNGQFVEGVCNGAVTHLEIGGCDLPDNAYHALSLIVADPKCVLRTLDLSYNKMPTTEINSIFRGLARNSSVQTLNLCSSFSVDVNTGEAFGALVKANKTLTTLDIGEHRTLLNLPYISFLSHLKDSHISVFKNEHSVMYAYQITHVANMVRDSPYLREIHMTGTICSSYAAREIFEAACKSRTLSHLDLSGSDLDDEVCDDLRALLLTDTCPLTTLNLRNTDLGDCTLDFIASTVALNPHLTSFHFGQHASAEGIDRFLCAIDENQTLTSLIFPNTDYALDRIKTFCERNATPFLRKRQATASSSPNAKSPRSD